MGPLMCNQISSVLNVCSCLSPSFRFGRGVAVPAGLHRFVSTAAAPCPLGVAVAVGVGVGVVGV